MSRQLRLSPSGIAQHLIQRGNNRESCFRGDEDYTAYHGWLAAYAQRFGLGVHAYVLMPNHVHLLVTPRQEGSIAHTLQALGRQYVRYFNQRHRRSGTLWEGRYRACLVESPGYLLECYRYIELNPLRAGQVDDPASYPWSSYRGNALGQADPLLTPHPAYQGLGRSVAARATAYRALLATEVTGPMIQDIRDTLNKELALGSEPFKDAIEAHLHRRVRPAKVGRPRKTGDSVVGSRAPLGS